MAVELNVSVMHSTPNRPLSKSERALNRWMLEHGNTEKSPFLHQLELAEVSPWHCSCGCATINFQIKGSPEALPGVHILGDYLFGDGASTSGIFIFESGGFLSGIEVYGLGGDAPSILPTPQELRTFENGQ